MKSFEVMMLSNTTRRLISTLLIICLIALLCLNGWRKTWNSLESATSHRIASQAKLPYAFFLTEEVEETENGEVKGKECKKLPDDIAVLGGIKDSSLCCKTCAIVSSSGTMLKGKFGDQIDDHDCVIRMNNAPTLKYEADVGTKTTLRVFSHTSAIDVINLLRTHTIERNNTVFVAWGPEAKMRPSGVTYNQLKNVQRLYPGIEIHYLSQNRMRDSDDKFEFETGKNRAKSGAYLSTGWFTILLAKDLCGNITVYGIVEEEFCKKVSLKAIKDAPYHYYRKSGGQCATYSLHQNVKAGGHRYFTEKGVFKKWAKEWGNMHFCNPAWKLD